MTATEQDKALNKIKKCLSMAASSNANEAATAMRQAQALMAQHNLTLTDVQAAEVTGHMAAANVKKKPTAWETVLAQTCAETFSCKLIFTTRTNIPHAGWVFIGVEPSPELAKYAFVVLLRQVKRDRSAYIKTRLGRCKTVTKTARADSFCSGWVWGASEKIPAIAPGTKASAAIAAYMEKLRPGLKDLKLREGNDGTGKKQAHADSSAGYQSGLDASLNRGMGGNEATTRLEHQS